jgi:hypothetical protein
MKHVVRSLIVMFCLVLLNVELTIYTSTAVSISEDPWWDLSWRYRTRVILHSGDYDRVDVVVSTLINFTYLLNASGTFDENSVRVVEYSTTGEILYEVPSQFDNMSNYDAVSNAVGTVSWIMNGTTPAQTKRIYYIYFDTLDNGPKNPPNYRGASSRIVGDYILLENEKINVTIRYRKNETERYGVYLEKLFFDRNGSGVFEPTEEMIGEELPYSLLIRVTDIEKNRHGWTDAFFWYNYDEEATVTAVRNGSIVQEIKLSNISLRNSNGESLSVDCELIFRIYKLSARLDIRTSLSINEDLDVSYAYERVFLNHKDLYDQWYIDEDYNGRFAYEADVNWFFSGSPRYGFIDSYNSSGSGGLAFIPNTDQYSNIRFGEFAVEGPALRLELDGGTWSTGMKIELENRLFAHLGEWSETKKEIQSISNPPAIVCNLFMHLVDSNGLDLDSAEVRIYNSKSALVKIDTTNATGWVTFLLETGNYTIDIFWMGVRVAEQMVFVSGDVTIDPLPCAVYSLSVYTTKANGDVASNVTVGIYQVNGTQMASLKTDISGQVLFQQLPAGQIVVKSFYMKQQFGIVKSLWLSENTGLTISEKLGLRQPRQFPYETVYALMLIIFVVVTAVFIRKTGYEKVKIATLMLILVLLTLFSVAYVQGHGFHMNSQTSGISAAYNQETGLVTVGDVFRIGWKDIDQDGRIDDSSIQIISWNGTKLAEIDLGTTLTTPVSVYKLYDAEISEVAYLDDDTNGYIAYKPLIQEPDLTNLKYQRSLSLRFAFLKTNHWEVNLFFNLEMGKPYARLRWEIVERGDGEGTYRIYPKLIPLFHPKRLILPANYTENKLRYWNQKNGPTYANPWRYETDWGMFGAYIANMHVNNGNLYLHSGQDYQKISTKVHAGSVFARYSKWIHNREESYFQYDFWVDWDGATTPSSDIKIEVWVPDALNLASSEISYSPDAFTWVKYDGWTLSEGNRDEGVFSSYKGSRHRLMITFPASNFTADDGVDTGEDYGIPSVGNDEYLVRLKVAYLNEGLTTYEFENSTNTWYGIRNLNDAWLWLIGEESNSIGLGITLTKSIEYLTVQANHLEVFKNVTLGIDVSVGNDSENWFHTNLVIFVVSETARQDSDSDGIWNLFDNDFYRYLPYSAALAIRESFGQIDYRKMGFNGEAGYHYVVFDKKSLANSWGVPALFTVCLPKNIDQHLESDDAIFLFERNGYYVYDVRQTEEILWKEKTADLLSMHQLYAIVGLGIIGFVLFVVSVDAVRKHWIIFALFFLGFLIRLAFQGLSVDFIGADAAVYANAAQNFLNYGKFQINDRGLEAHWVKAGAIPTEITRPFNQPSRIFYPSLIVCSFALFGQSFASVKFVDVVLGALIIFPVFYMAKRLFDQRTAIVATIIVVFHPLLIYYSGVHPSTNIIPALFGTAALCAMVYESKKTAVVAGFFAGLLLFARLEYGFILLGVVASYYILNFKWGALRKRTLYIIGIVFFAVLAGFFIASYLILGSLPFYSTKVLGGTMGETRAPTLWETLSNPTFVQIRLYNALYGWWYVLFQNSPLIFATALLGLLVYVGHWKKLSALYLFPIYGIFAYSLSIRTLPHARFVVQYIPVLTVLAGAFIVWLAEFALPKHLSNSGFSESVNLKRVLLVFLLLEIVMLTFLSHYLVINVAMRNLAWKYNDGKIYRWFDVNTSPKAVIMVRSPLYTFYTGRETVGIPMPIQGKVDVDLDMIIYVIKHYNVDYIVIDRNIIPIPALRQIRQNPLEAPPGFNLVYWDANSANFDPQVLVYDVRALHEG